MLAEMTVWMGAIAVLAVLVHLVYKAIQYKRTIDFVPGPWSYPIIGNIKFMFSEPDKLFKYMKECSNNFSKIWKIWIGHRAIIFLINPDDIEQVLSSQKHIDKSAIYEALWPWLNSGLLTSTGEKWHTRRKILTPAFHFNILQQFLPIFVEHSENLVQNLKKECDNESTNVVPYMAQTTLHAICETAMGTNLDPGKKIQREYVDGIYKVGDLIINRLTRPWLHNTTLYNLLPAGRLQNRILKTLHKFTTDVIRDRQQNFVDPKILQTENDEQNDEFNYRKKKRLAMLDLLLSAKADGADIDEEGIREEVDTFMFEGHDTTSMCLCFTLMIIACHPEIQEKIVQEIDEVVGKKWPPTYQNLQEMQFLERCIKESLRLYPSVPIISRSLNEDLKTASGYIIPAKTIIILHIQNLHRQPEVYPEPEKFDPDRFLPEASRVRHPFAYIPFSAGPRNCIGQRFALLELKTIVSSILRNYVLEPVDTPDTLNLVVDLVLRTKNSSVSVKFKPRVH